MNRELFEAEESVTLVRSIIRGVYVNDGASERAVLALHKSNPDTTSPAISESTTVGDVYDVDSEKLLNLWSQGLRGSTTVLATRVEADVSGMRKMKKGEKVYLAGAGNTAAGGTFAGTVTLFFKE